jgi:hypothetical protein
MFGRQQMTQRVGYRILTLLSGKVQNLHVHPVCHLFCMSTSQCVPCHAKTARGKHFFAVSIVGEGSGFSHQRINDVSIIDRCQLLTNQSRHRLNMVSLMYHRDLFSTNPQIDELIDQPTGNRIRIRSHANRTAACHPNAFHDVIGVETFIGQTPQVRLIFKEVFPPVVVGSPDQFFHEGDILFPAGKVATAAQHQRLLDAVLEMSVGRFHVAVLVGTASVRAFRFAVVVTHQRRVSLSQFPATGMIPHGGRQ